VQLVTSQPDEEGVIEEDPGDQEGDECYKRVPMKGMDINFQVL